MTSSRPKQKKSSATGNSGKAVAEPRRSEAIRPDYRSNIAEDLQRTGVLALLQLVPMIGGTIGQIAEHAWAPLWQKKVETTLDFFVSELDALHASIESVGSRLANDEQAQRLFVQCIEAAPQTISDEERQRLGRLLARGLSGSEMNLADVCFMVRKWRELDDVEMLLFLLIAKASRESKQLSRDYRSLVGSQYFAGAEHYERMYKDDIHRKRIDHLLAIGLIRPADPKGWNEGKYGYFLEHFWLTAVGRSLYSLVSEDSIRAHGPFQPK